MSHRVTMKRWTYDNAQPNVTVFRPISEAAHSWSYDKNGCVGVNDKNWPVLCPAGGYESPLVTFAVNYDISTCLIF